jgi:DNA polymerase-3 subunit epsilon/ATP-dependent DNA helicase DinG
MRGELFAVDLETTGFDSVQDEIIEIGAVRMIDGEIVDSFSTFVNPKRSIPQPVTLLTGIRDQDVSNAPDLRDVLPELQKFVGSSAWIAHNISFDASFLNKRGALLDNPRIDTYELASILLPNAPRYSLGSLTAQFGADIGSAHRALDDARASAIVYWELWGLVQKLPAHVIAEVLFFASDLRWDGRLVFEEALREKSISRGEIARELLFSPDMSQHTGFADGGGQTPLEIDRVTDVFSPKGPLAQLFEGYEARPGQAKMASAVAHAFNESKALMVEAGTGTGKSLAYLTPALLWALQNQQRVVISTNTINLQEQLLNRDIPQLKAALGLSFSAALLKGRGNYLCPRRFEFTRRRHVATAEELRVLAKVLIAAQTDWNGDRGEISLRNDEESAWQRLSAADEICAETQCETRMNGRCPFFKARRVAEGAHLLVVNHALLISDALSENMVLPDYDYLIIDEAHQLEDAITNGLSVHIDEGSLRGQLAVLGGVSPRRGLLGLIADSVEPVLSLKANQRFQTFAGDIGDAVTAMNVHITTLFKELRAFAHDQKAQPIGEQTTQLRVAESHRTAPHFTAAQNVWNVLDEFFQGIAEGMSDLGAALASLDGSAIPNFDDLVSAAGATARRLSDLRLALHQFLVQPTANDICWLTISQDKSFVSLNRAPLHVGSYVKDLLLDQKESVVLTSATLQIDGNFAYLQERLGAEGIRTLDVGSPFDFPDSVMLYLPNDLPDPSDKGRYQSAVERGIIELSAALHGRTMVLFTSYAQLRQTSAAIAPRLQLGGIEVFDQSDGSSRQTLLDGFRNTRSAVLLATRSFWEGVDIPGESLSALVIVRLPFAVPNDPIVQARSETYPDSFQNYSLPDAILRFRQGFGRLIRSQTDRGVVVVLDNRLLTKAYGGQFIDALPSPTLQTGALSQLPEAAKAWLKLTLS